MELDWSTFLLEIVNFLILVWILKRFLYLPILNAIASRKSAIEKSLDEAEKNRAGAERLKEQNERKVKEWEAHRQSLESELSADIAAKREKLLADLDVELGKEKSRQAALMARDAEESNRAMENTALLLGASFSSKLLSRLASPELEAMLFDVFIEDLAKTAKMQIDAKGMLAVSSAFPLPEEKRRLLLEKMQGLLGHPLESSFSENPELICGIKVSIGAWILHANLKEELAYFREALGNER
ncbi:MAG TPA: F0F1 ATP synthase subunit delta [Burkholderiales bacterium]|nr:F0F1 ATP synthase subunit delta [Burkholderiales bacterium]